MDNDINQKIISGVKWNLFGQIGRQSFSFIISVIFARLLEPKEFGLFGMLFIFTYLASAFIDSGFGGALIQKKNITEKDCSSVFYFNIFASLIFYLILFFVAPIIARFYNQPELVALTRLISLVFVINSFGMVHTSLIIKNLFFKENNLIVLVGVIISGIFALILAYNNFGVYCLVFQAISYSLVTNILYFFYYPWTPKFIFSFSSLIGLFGFGSKMLLHSIIVNFFLYIDNLWIGKLFSATFLGFYFRAKSTKDLISNNFSGILTSICFPIFSKINDNDEELIKYNHKFIRLVSFLIIPVFTGLFIVSKSFVIVLFSDKWLPSVEMLKLFCLIGISYPLSIIPLQTIMAKGRSGLMLKLEIVKKSFLVIVMLIGLKYGIIIFLKAMVVESYISLFLNFYFTARLLKIGIIEYYKDIYPSLMLSISMGLFIYLISLFLCTNILLILVVQIFSGLFFYIVLSKLLRMQEYFIYKYFIMNNLHLRK